MKELADILVVVITLCGFLGSIFIGIKFRRTLPPAKRSDIAEEKKEVQRVVEKKKEQNRTLPAEELAERFNRNAEKAHGEEKKT